MIHYSQLTTIELVEGHFNRHTYPWHYHDSYTVVLVEEGAVEYVFTNGSVTVHQHEILIINPYQAHYNHEAHAGGWTFKVFFLPITLFNSLPGTITYFITKTLRDKALFTSLLFLHQQLLTHKGEHGATASIQQQLLLLLLQHAPYQQEKPAIDVRVHKATDYIQQHLHERLPIKKLAAMVNVSPFYFQRLFKRDTGLSVNAYIQLQRMEEGRKLLREGTSLVGTALETGYFDQSHFHHQFKRMYGLTPKQFSKHSTVLQEKGVGEE